jgi:hypothetical protein
MMNKGNEQILLSRGTLQRAVPAPVWRTKDNNLLPPAQVVSGTCFFIFI